MKYIKISIDKNSMLNPISGKELLIYESLNINLQYLKQIIGNLGGYANTEYVNGSIIILNDQMISNIENNINDSFIDNIEKMFKKTIRYISLSEFINWAKTRQMKINDECTLKLINKL